jgi:hypothetical protein
MSFSESLLYLAMATLVLLGLIIVIARHVKRDTILVPYRHITVEEMDYCHPQEVFDWVAFVTLVSGTAYVKQLAYNRGCVHEILLSDLCIVAHCPEHEIPDRLREVGRSHRLNTVIVDQPY